MIKHLKKTFREPYATLFLDIITIFKKMKHQTLKKNNFYLHVRNYFLEVLENHVANISRRVNVLKCSWYVHVHVFLFR